MTPTTFFWKKTPDKECKKLREMIINIKQRIFADFKLRQNALKESTPIYTEAKWQPIPKLVKL